MNIYYAKSILYAYSSIDKLTAQIDDIVLKHALASMNNCAPCFKQCDKIVAFTNKKIRLMEMKDLVERALNEYTQEEITLLDYKYFRIKPRSVYKDFDCHSRSYFRKQNKLSRKFAENMERFGLNDKRYKEIYLSMDFFKELLKRVIEHDLMNNKNKKAPVKMALKKSA